MRKHDEGYALVLVLVVMVVVCLAAVSIMTVSVENLQDQQASVTRMQEKYEAQGKIEMFYANLLKDIKNTSEEKYSLKETTVQSLINIGWNQVEEENKNLVENIAIHLDDAVPNVVFISFDAYGGTAAHISCVISITSENAITVKNFDGEVSYVIAKPEIEYTKYEIALSGGGAA